MRSSALGQLPASCAAAGRCRAQRAGDTLGKGAFALWFRLHETRKDSEICQMHGLCGLSGRSVRKPRGKVANCVAYHFLVAVSGGGSGPARDFRRSS